MKVWLSEVAEEFAGVIHDQRGENVEVTAIRPAGDCGPGDLVFTENEEHARSALAANPSGMVMTEALADELTDLNGAGVLVASNVRLAHALIKQRYGDRDWQDDEVPPVHPSAAVHDSATLGEGSRVSANAVIGAGSVLGARCRVLDGAVIENGATLGEDCIVHPTAVVGYNCRLGDRVDVGAGSVIGSEGYGFAQDSAGRSHRIPQTGSVVIEDDVRMGANNCIDRPPYGVTRIGRGTKIDNLCHIAHGVEVGEDCLLTAMLCVAGSTKIGNRVMTSGQTGMLGHLTVCDDTGFADRAAVVKDITEPGMYAGLPLQPLKDHLKTSAQLKKLGDYSKKLRELERKVKALEAEIGAASSSD
ncbi:MAG: UDP-3-O-(3-hydroxymyristoyl)glucosamine N-acyltransferase [Pseudomonadota bacterium]